MEKTNSLQQLNEEQQLAIRHGEGPLLIIAGAGTGKTTVITERIKHLILEKKVQPSHILALTFTEKAAAEMEERIDIALPYGYTQMWIETFHAFCDRLLRLEAINIGLNPRFDLLTEAEALLFLRKNLFSFELDYFRPLGNPMKFLQGMLQHFSRLKDDDTTPEQYLSFAKKLAKTAVEPDELKKTTELAHAFEKYETLKTKEGVMDFSDLISNTLKLFRERPHILKQYQEHFQYILVDEFQDTNYAQNEMAILLSGSGSAGQNITVVGDDDQSIYRWRGAALANMMQFRSHFPKAKIIALTKNYRSTQVILDSAYQAIQHNNPDRLEVKEGIAKKLAAMRRDEKGEAVDLIYTNRVEEEAEAVAKYIRDEVSAKGGSSSGRKNYNYNDFAILVRANDHAQPFVRSLERAHVPYQFLGPGHLFQQEEIKDLIAYLRVLANFEDASSLYRILTMSVFGIESRDIASLLNFGKRNNCSLFEAMEQVTDAAVTMEGKEKISKVVQMIKKHLEKIAKEPAGQILYYFFEASGLLGYYLDPRSPKTEREAQNIARLFEKLHSFASNREDASVFAVVDWIDLSMELGESPLAAEIDWTANNAVNILTVHSSKGLEFPVVFVVNLVSQRFPSRDRKEQIPVPQAMIKEELPTGDENLQEERRLFYVAITRARDKLFLTAAKFYGEAKRERKLSPFVVEALGEEYVQKVVKKVALTQTVQQLSLLDMVNTNIANAPKEEKSPMVKIPIRQPITYISYSQINAFQTCPLHYKLRYILNVPTPPSPALSYGLSVHNTLRDFFQLVRAKEKMKAEGIHDLLKKNWIRLGYTSKIHEEQAYKQADTMLFSVAKNSLLEPAETLALELPFQFFIKQLKVGGRIDRIDRKPDGRIEIIDYKTGSNIPDEKKVQEDLQLTFYALAATEIHDGILNRTPDDIILTLYYLEANKRISTVRTKDELEAAKEKILTIVDDIAKSDFLCYGSIFCKNCEYKMLCSTYTS
ncbi:MAG: ATP-dependent helicase [Candidatus Levybacteria bacterium]|nr:ATP-dependent helicase [Candidatus Levybacteria bacterium]